MGASFPSVQWYSSDEYLYSTWARTSDGERVNLCVEAVPDGGWDWLVWSVSNSDHSLRGVETTLVRAMVSAERASASLLRLLTLNPEMQHYPTRHPGPDLPQCLENLRARRGALQERHPS